MCVHSGYEYTQWRMRATSMLLPECMTKGLPEEEKKNKVKYPAYTFGPLFSNRHSHFRRQTILSQRCR